MMPVQPTRIAPVRLLACLALLVAGCGGDDAPKRYDVRGTVTYAGEKLAYGTVTFIPKEGPAGSAQIQAGAFDTASGGRGIVGGPHRVVITGFDGNADPEAELPHGKPLFEEFEVQHEFPAVDEAEGPVEVTFDVPKK